MQYRFDNRKEYDIKMACLEYNFRASPQFWRTSQNGILATWNGIGGKDGWKPPKTAYGLNMELASAQHDVDFELGETWDDFDQANDDYLFNNYQIIDKESTWFLKWFRKRRMYKYYLGVHLGGAEYFWSPAKLKRMGIKEPPLRRIPQKLRDSIIK